MYGLRTFSSPFFPRSFPLGAGVPHFSRCAVSYQEFIKIWIEHSEAAKTRQSNLLRFKARAVRFFSFGRLARRPYRLCKPRTDPSWILQGL